MGLSPRPRWRDLYSAPPDYLAVFQGLTSKGKGGEDREYRKRKGGEKPVLPIEIRSRAPVGWD